MRCGCGRIRLSLRCTTTSESGHSPLVVSQGYNLAVTYFFPYRFVTNCQYGSLFLIGSQTGAMRKTNMAPKLVTRLIPLTAALAHGKVARNLFGGAV